MFGKKVDRAVVDGLVIGGFVVGALGGSVSSVGAIEVVDGGETPTPSIPTPIATEDSGSASYALYGPNACPPNTELEMVYPDVFSVEDWNKPGMYGTPVCRPIPKTGK